MDTQKLIQAARSFASRHLPTTAKGNATLASLLGKGLRVIDRASDNGRAFRMTGNGKLSRLADSLTGSASSMLRQKGTAALIRAASDKAAAQQTRALIKGLVVPESYAEALWNNPDMRVLGNKLRNQVQSLPTIDTDKMSDAMKHKVRANYLDTLRHADHGAPSNIYDAVEEELGTVMNSRKGVKDAVADLQEITIPSDVPGVGGQKVPVTARNLNGVSYWEEAAATPEQRQRLATAMARSNVPIGTTVMADIGSGMLRDKGLHVVGVADGAWFDPTGRYVRVPKLIVVNDAALKAGKVEDVIAQHRELYEPTFIRRTRFKDQAALDTIRGNKNAFKNWARAYKPFLTDADKDTMAAFNNDVQAYMEAANGGALPAGFRTTPKHERMFRQQVTEARKALSAAKATGDAAEIEKAQNALNTVKDQYDQMRWFGKVPEGAKVSALPGDLGELEPNAHNAVNNMEALNNSLDEFSAGNHPVKLQGMLRDGTSRADARNIIQARKAVPEYPAMDGGSFPMMKLNPDTLTKRGSLGKTAASGWTKTLRNAWNLYRTHPLQALQKTVEYGAVKGPLNTVMQAFNPKTLVSNRALGARYLRTGYDSVDDVRELIRRNRAAQAVMLGGLTVGGAGLAAIGGLGSDGAKQAPVRGKAPEPVTSASAEPAAAPAVPMPVNEPAAADTTGAAAGGAGMYAKALDWARNHKTELGAGAALTAAILGGAYMANRKKRRRRRDMLAY